MLTGELKSKDAVINDLMRSINDIQDNLNQIKLKEKNVTLNTQEHELKKNKTEQIKSDIQFIYDLLNKNRHTLAAMNEKVKGSDLKIAELEKFIGNLTAQTIDQEAEIGTLKDKVTKLNIELNTLDLSLEKERKESAEKTEKLNTVYCAIGTLKELMKEGLVVKKGSTVGIGKTPELNPNLTTGLFSAIDIYGTREISIAAKKVKIISGHTSGSYRLEEKASIKKLVILNPDEFWKTSKYLIIEISGEGPQED